MKPSQRTGAYILAPTYVKGLTAKATGRLARLAQDTSTARLATFSAGLFLVAAGLLYAAYRIFGGCLIGDLSPSNAGDVLGGVMALITTALLIGGGVFALVEYLQREHQHSFHLHKDLIERLASDQDVEARRWVLDQIKPPPGDEAFIDMCLALELEAVAWEQAKEVGNPPALDAEWVNWREATRRAMFDDNGGIGRKHVKHILNTYDYVGFVVLKYWDLDRDLVAWLSPMVVKVWRLIGPYVEREARWRHEPGYYVWARQLGDRMVEWAEGSGVPKPIDRKAEAL